MPSQKKTSKRCECRTEKNKRCSRNVSAEAPPSKPYCSQHLKICKGSRSRSDTKNSSVKIRSRGQKGETKSKPWSQISESSPSGLTQRYCSRALCGHLKGDSKKKCLQGDYKALRVGVSTADKRDNEKHRKQLDCYQKYVPAGIRLPGADEYTSLKDPSDKK